MAGRWRRLVSRLILVLVAAVVLAGRASAQAVTGADKLNAEVERLYRAGKYAEAVPLAQRALALHEKFLGPYHLNVADAHVNLADLYVKQGRFDDAEPHYNQSLAIREKTQGPSHPDVSFALNNLGVLYEVHGRYAEAEPIFKRCLGLREAALGPEHPDVAQSLNNLASLYANQGRYSEAEALYTRSLAIREKALGPDDPDVAMSLYKLASLYDIQGRSAMAEGPLKRAIKIFEAALGSDHHLVGLSLNNLGLLRANVGSFGEAEPLYKRAIEIFSIALGPDSSEIGTALNNLAELYDLQGRTAEAEPLHKRSLSIRETTLGHAHPHVGQSLNNLAALYVRQGRYSEAELLHKRSQAILEKALGPEHPQFGMSLNNLGFLYDAQGRTFEAEVLYKRSLYVWENALGPDHLDVALSLNNLAWVALRQNDFQSAADRWRRATAVLQRRAERRLPRAAEGSPKREAQRNSWYFAGLVKTMWRLAAKGNGDAILRAAEMFETAQWGAGSEAATSLAQMAARSDGRSPQVAALVRERQDLVTEWQTKDKQLIAARSESPARRSAQAEKTLGDRLAGIDSRLAAIDATLAKDFPDYAALTSPKPISVVDVQANLRDDEALVLFLDTEERFKPLPEETFVWVVTKGDVKWLRSDLGTAALKREVAALRCGLDATAWYGEGALRCADLLKLPLDKAPAEGAPLPFDAARAHALHKSLLGEAADLIKGKHLMVVPSGALTTLPFQVLVPALPDDVVAGETTHVVGRLGAELGPLNSEVRKGLPAGASGGVIVVKPVAGGPAEAAGLKAGDIFLAVGEHEFSDVPSAVSAVQAAGAGNKVVLKLVRDGKRLDLPVTLGTVSVKRWTPYFIDAHKGKNVRWLIRDHAITVLPSVAALKSLRRTGKSSAAAKPMIGFANPLLDGDQQHPNYGPWHKRQAQRARLQTGCAPTVQRTAGLRGIRRSASAVPQPAGLADLSHLRAQAPLPETADEVCDVARSIGADVADVRIGARATETELKRLSASGDLAKYRILHFATHGLLAGQLTGTREPGLVMTPPATATAEDDGYLSGSEIASLKLDADWVILSACNTAGGAQQGEAAEALSGLARVFFYAGTRALLVSHWEVDSDAAVKLVTAAVGALAKDKTIGRAEALRLAMLGLMTDATRPKNWVPAWHPAIWAPFVVVGEGGAGR